MSIVLACANAEASSPDDPAVFAKIDSWKTIAESIVVDGDCSDWGAIAVFADPAGDAGGDATRDITGVAIAPLDDRLKLRIDVSGTPAAAADDFWIEVDFRKQQYWDLKFSLSSTFEFFDYFPETGEGSGARLAWTTGKDIDVGSDCVEAEILYSTLDPLLPVVMQGQLSGASARSWVRVRATTGEPLDFSATEIDHGSAVGSFRLIATPYTLDPAAPPGATQPFETRLPLLGNWYLGQGSHGVGTHAGIPWAYDWHRVDNALLPEVPQRSSDNLDNFSFGEAIYAPEAGTVSSLVDTEPDCTPYASCGGTFTNFLFLEVPGDVGIFFNHTQQGSIPFAASDPVANDAQIGAVGNAGSGFSFAHLHHEAQDISGPPDDIALALTDVDIGLNTDLGSDPWKRAFASWVPREGFFARRSAVGLPALWGPGIGLLAIGLVGVAWGASRNRR
jgi:hypothetical protein